MLEHIAVGNLLNSIIPISRFNRGEANKIFEEVNASGFKVVVKNNRPACVLLAPDKYAEIMEAIEDYALFNEAEKRMAESNGETIPHEDILREFGITEEDLAAVDVEIEL